VRSQAGTGEYERVADVVAVGDRDGEEERMEAPDHR